MKAMKLVFMTGLWATSSFGHSSAYKSEVVEEQPKTETKTFCAKGNAEEAELQCEKWLNRQVKTLGDKVLTSSCSSGDMTTDSNCLYKAQGDVTWVMKKHRTETERN